MSNPNGTAKDLVLGTQQDQCYFVEPCSFGSCWDHCATILSLSLEVIMGTRATQDFSSRSALILFCVLFDFPHFNMIQSLNTQSKLQRT